jgi:hypothetical protein
LPSNLGPPRKKGGKHAWQRVTSLTSNLSPSRVGDNTGKVRTFKK